MKKKIYFVYDVFINVLSSALPIIVLQLITFPLIASQVGGENYGTILSLISLITIIAFPLGNVLNNTRLLRAEEYDEKGYTGDFNLILFGSLIIGGLFVIVFSSLINSSLGMLSLFLIIIITAIWIVKEYFIVGFRITLNYKGIFISNLVLSAGYLVGTVIFMYTNKWEYIYIIGLIFSLLFLIAKLNLHKEPLIRTPIFKNTLKINSQLYIASLIKNLVNYSDRIILLTLLGSYNVSIFYSATIIGKMILMIINPLNSVMLSYLVKTKSISTKQFTKLLIYVTLAGTLSYFLILFISPYFLNFFYPQWAKEALKIVNITTAIVVIGMISSIIHPFNLRFNNAKWQIYMNSIYLVSYLIFGIVLGLKNGLLGFSIGLLLASAINFLIQITVFLYNRNFNKFE